MACEGIVLGSVYDCDSPPQPGVEKRLILINRDDIEAVAFDAGTGSIIESITIATGKMGFAFNGFKNSLQPQYTLVPGTVSVGYDHQVQFNVWEISQAQKDNLEELALGKVVAIVENVRDDENAFEVYGLNVGLEAQEITRIATDVDTAGSFTVLLKTSDDSGKESKMPQTWFDTDYATTKGLVDATLSAAP